MTLAKDAYLYTMLDYLVIGLGLAGISFCEQLERYGKSYRVISDHSQTSSFVAGGIYNPVNINRFSLVWEADEQLRTAVPFYTALERKLAIPLHEKTPILRRISSVLEQEQWNKAFENIALRTILAPGFSSYRNRNLLAPFGYVEVRGTGRVNTKALLKAYAEYLRQGGQLQTDTFHPDLLQIDSNSFSYGSVRAAHLVFATGFGLRENPWFDYLPLTGNKGEYIIVRAPELQEKNIIKGPVFCIPMGGDLYRIGATYDREDKTRHPTAKAKSELRQKLEEFLTCKYTVEDQVTGIRPTVADHRPLVGVHPSIARMYVLNGLGSRGVMTAPYAAKILYDHIASSTPVPPEMDLARFERRWTKIRR